jgi:hypothetical protein
MRAHGAGKKKLIVAFHFQMAAADAAGRTGWNCESCRMNGLEIQRRCGFLPDDKRGEPRVVWGRRQTVAEECPKSYVTAESLGLIEEFFVRRRLGIADSLECEARKVDAFVILQDLMEKEQRDAASQY